MFRVFRHFAVAFVVAVGFGAGVAGSAEAGKIVGNPMDAPPAGGPTGGATPSTVLIQHQPASEVEAPSAGVLTEIRAHHGPIDATPPTWGWRLVSGTSPNFTLRRIGTLADAPLPANRPAGFLTWQLRDELGQPIGAPVAVGDKLGWVGFGANAFEVLFRETAGGTTSFASNTGNVGAFTMGVNDGAVPQVQFVLEPDADGDSYGDETQDGCTGTSGTARGCPAVPCASIAPTLVGTNASETIVGTAGNDVIVSLGGDDIIRGLGGDYIICGGDGNDKLKGGAGEDRLFGETGRDKLRGGNGKDSCFGGPDKDAIGCEKAKQK